MSEATIVLVLGSTVTGRLRATTSVAYGHGLRIAAVTGPKPSTRMRAYLNSIDAAVTVNDLYDPVTIANAACEAAGGTPAAVLSWDDATSPVAAEAGELLGVARTSARAMSLARNKLAARQVFAAAGLANPPFAPMSSAGEAAGVASVVGLPAIVKPVNGTASSAVRHVESVEQLASAYEDLVKVLPGMFGGMFERPLPALDGAAPIDPSRTFLVEGMLTGIEYSFDLMIRDGKVERLLILDKFLIEDGFLECGFAYPPLDLPEDTLEQSWQTVERAVTSLGLDNTMAHVEIFDDPRLGPTIIEVNPGRNGGGVLPRMIGGMNGVDLLEEYLALQLGWPPSPRHEPRYTAPIANLCFYPGAAGVLVGLGGVDAVAAHPSALEVESPDMPCGLTGDDEAGQFNVIAHGLGTREALVTAYREMQASLAWDVRWAGWSGTRKRPRD